MKDIQNNTPSINEVSRLASGSYQSGDFFSEHDVRIDGRFDGTLTTRGRVVIGEEALVKGTIICESLDIWGKVHGDVFVKDILSLKEASVLDGDFCFGRVQIEIGADITGACSKMTDEAFEARIESMIPEAFKPSAES